MAHSFKVFFFLGLLNLFGTPLFAQQTGNLRGRVIDGSNGEAITGMLIEVTSDQLLGKRTTLSTRDGEFVINLLPPGRYQINGTKQGWIPIGTVAEIGLGQTTRFEFRTHSNQISIPVVVLSNPLPDTSQVSSQIDAEMVDRLANGRGIADITLLAAGVNEGGTAGPITISGAPSYESLFLLNGGVVNFDNRRGQPSDLVIEDAIQRVTVMTGAIPAEYGQFSGGVVNTITQSGGNEFSGTLRLSLSNEDWQARTPLQKENSTFEQRDQINDFYTLTLGGPIVKDRLWFFAAVRREQEKASVEINTPAPIDDTLASVLGLPPGQTTPPVSSVPSELGNDRYEFKLSGRIADGHELVASFAKLDRERTNVAGGRVASTAALLPKQEIPEQLLSINYRGILTPALAMDIFFTEKKATFRDRIDIQRDDQFLERYTVVEDTREPIAINSPSTPNLNPEDRDNRTIKLKFSYFASSDRWGSHDLTFGLQDYRDSRKANSVTSPTGWTLTGYIRYDAQNRPSPVFLSDPANNVLSLIQYTAISNLSQGSDFTTRSGFLNDDWTLNRHWRFNVGLRLDKNDATAQDGSGVSNATALSPRLGVEYDLRGDGIHRFSAGFNRYTSRLADIAGSATIAGEQTRLAWSYQGPRTESVADVLQWFEDTYGNPLSQAAINASIFRFQPDPANRLLTVDPDLESPYSDEFHFGYHLLWPNKGHLRVDYLFRDYKKFYVDYRNLDIGRTPDGSQDAVLIGNDDGTYQRTYHGVNVQGLYRINQNLNTGVAYTWSHLYGNLTGENGVQGAARTGSLTSYPEFNDFPARLQIGDLPGDMRHAGRLWLDYQREFSIGTLSFTLMERFATGQPIPTSFVVPSISAYGFPDNPGYAAPPRFSIYEVAPSGTFRADGFTQTDLALQWDLTLGKTTWFAQVELFNAFNEDALANPNRGIDFSVSTRAPFNVYTEIPQEGVNYEFGPNFGKANSSDAFQRPREIRFDFGVKF